MRGAIANQAVVAVTAAILAGMLGPTSAAASTTSSSCPPPTSGNLVCNGDFSAGNLGFASDYAYSPSGLGAPATYSIAANPNSLNGAWPALGDHTTGSGLMMIVNGATVANQTVWSEAVSVAPNTQYQVTTWIASLYSSPALLQWYVDGIPLDSPFSAPTQIGAWMNHSVSWRSGSSTSVLVSIVDQNLDYSGNDFALDDISIGPPPTDTRCNEAGQMADPPQSLTYDAWTLTYGISKCEGLVVSDVSLKSRLMAERISLPYLDLQTCTGPSGVPSNVSGCATSVLRHIALRRSDDEVQEDPSAFTHVQLISPFQRPELFDSGKIVSNPCNGAPPCEHFSIQAKYRISLSASTGTSADQYLDVTQRYEFYRDFKEADYPHNLACEPSQDALITFGPLADCGRWKPLVFYQYHMGNSKQILVQLNAAERVHYTPDALAARGSTFIRDCDSGTPQSDCLFHKAEVFHDPVTGNLENPPPRETVIRAIQATDSGVVGNKAGRYDNVHLTPKSDVGLPLPPPGCPECAHMHWRWGADLSKQAAFGFGKPLLADGEPGAGPTNSRQQLDVALVAYHPDELAPHNFMDLVERANTDALDMHLSTSTAFVGGSTQGKDTLSYPPETCYAASDLSSWGKCGQVVWLSASAFANSVNPQGVGDEDSDTFFAFGGFFCGVCSDAQYSTFLGFKPHYSPAPNALVRMSPGQHLRIAFGPLLGPLPMGVDTQLFDVLPKGMTSITVKINQVSSAQFSENLISCSTAVQSSGLTLVSCHIQQPTSFNGLPPPCTDNSDGNSDGNTVSAPCIVIEGNVSTTAGDYQNVVHVVWSSARDLVAGNLKQIDPVTVV